MMNLEQLRNGFEKLFKRKFIFKRLMKMEMFKNCSESEVMAKALSDIVTEDMLEYINEHLQYVHIVNMKVYGKERTMFDDMLDYSIANIEENLDEPQFMQPDEPLLSNKKVFCMGRGSVSGGFGFGLDEDYGMATACECIFIDEESNIFWAKEYFRGFNYMYQENKSDEDSQSYEYEIYIYKKIENINFCFLDGLEDFIPEEYAEIFLEE